MSASRPEDLCLALQSAIKGKRKPAKILQILGAKALIDSVGLSGIRSLFNSCSDRTWQRMKKELGSLSLTANQKNQAMVKMNESLKKFEPLRTV